MDYCINESSNDYKELFEVFGSTEIIHALWDRNKGNNLDKDPDGNDSILFNQLLQLTNNNRYDALRMKSRFYLDSYTDMHGKWYDNFIEEPELDFPQSTKKLISFVSKMSNKFGYAWDFAEEGELPSGVAAGIRTTGKHPVAIFRKDKLATSDVIHEFGHLILNHIKRDNSELHDNLWKEFENMSDGFKKEMWDYINSQYPGYTQIAKKDELLTHLLETYGNELVDKETGLFKALTKVWEYVIKVVADVFGVVDVSKLKPNTTLVELAYIIADPNIKLSLGEIFGSGELKESYSGEYDLSGNAPFKVEGESTPFTIDEIKTKLLDASKNIVKEDVEVNGKIKEKRFLKIDDNTKQPLIGIKRYMAEKWGYGSVEASDEDALPLRIGKTIHGHVDNISKDIIDDLSDKYKVNLTPQAKKDIEKIFKKLKGKATALTEVEICDPEKGFVGIIDLILITDTGRVQLYDFKTKIRPLVEQSNGEFELSYSRFDYYNRKNSWSSHTQQEVDHLQISMYAYMIQKVLQLPVSSISIVKLDAVAKGKEIKSNKYASGKEFVANVDSKGYTKVESVEVHTESEEILELPFFDESNKMLLHHRTRRIYEGDEAYLHSSTLENREKFRKEGGEKDFVNVTESASEAGELLEKLKSELDARLKIARKRFDIGQRGSLEDLMDIFESEQSTTTSLYHIILNAAEAISQLDKEYTDYLSNSTPFTPGLLYRWKDIVQSYKSLQELKDLFIIHPEIIPDKNYVKKLNIILEKVNFYENQYKKEGRYLIAKWLAPFYNGIKVKHEDLYKAEWRRKRHQEVKKGKMSLDEFEKQFGTIEEYVEKGMKGQSAKVDKETFNLLYKELEIASRDIGELTRWLDNMLDSSDPVASALVSAFMTAEELSRLSAIDKKYEIADALEELMKHRNKKVFSSEEGFYSFMLEHDEEGKTTQYLLRPYKSTFWEDIENIRKENKLSRTKEETADVVKSFAKMHREFDDDAFREGLQDFLNELRVSKIISVKEIQGILEYIEGRSMLRINDIIRMEDLNDEAKNAIENWFGKNVKLFYIYSEKYSNKEWDDFMKLCGIDTKQSLYAQYKALKDSKNPYAIFYTKIEEIANQANYMIPNGYRLFDRLPGVIKLNNERIKAGQNPFTIAKNNFDVEFFVRPEDVERGSKETTNEFGRVKYFIPVYYTAKVEPENQSYDIAGIYFKFWESANDYRAKRNILPELEMTRYFINERRALKRSVFKDVLKTSGNTDEDKEPVYKDRTTLAEMLNDWFEMALYGKYTKDEKALVRLSDKKSIDIMKSVDLLNRYTSLNLLGGNIVQGFANVLIGEIMQSIEVIAHEYVSAKSYTKAAALYTQFLPQVLGDVGRNVPKTLPGLLYQEFNVLDEDISETMFTTNTATGKFLKNTSIYFVQHAGEHWLQNRFLLAMLMEKHMVDLNGNDVGTLFNQYEVVNGRLKLKQESSMSAVDYQKFLVKNNWTAKDIQAFKQKIKGVLSRMHGEYSELGRVAIQRTALGRMAYMFRKFVVPGFRRRWGREMFIERIGQYVEGNYISTIKFFRNYWRDLFGLKFALMSENWAALSDHEKANIRRTLAEATFVIGAIIAASALAKAGDDDDDEWLISFLAYQSYRLRAELLFFTPKIDEAWSILRSPMASMAVLQNLIDLAGQLSHPAELYERGPWKGQLKLKKIMFDFIPIYKQIYKARDIEQQISWFRND